MKHLKTYESLKIEDIKIGDYVTINSGYYHNQLPVNCVKITSELYYNTFNTEPIFNVEYITEQYESDTSYLFISQIGDFASQDDINKFESILASKKYNL